MGLPNIAIPDSFYDGDTELAAAVALLKPKVLDSEDTAVYSTVTPDFVGQILIENLTIGESTTQAVYLAKGATSSDWGVLSLDAE